MDNGNGIYLTLESIYTVSTPLTTCVLKWQESLIKVDLKCVEWSEEARLQWDILYPEYNQAGPRGDGGRIFIRLAAEENYNSTTRWRAEKEDFYSRFASIAEIVWFLLYCTG